MTGILMELPFHFIPQIDGSLVQIHTKFNDDSMSFIQVLFVLRAQTWQGFWTRSSHGISMEFPWHFLRKWWDFLRIWTHFRTKPNSRENFRVTFNYNYYFNVETWENLESSAFVIVDNDSSLIIIIRVIFIINYDRGLWL